MCGILFSANLSLEKVMLGATKLGTRGPDFQDFLIEGGYVFFHSLLSVTKPYAPQPYVSERVILIFNGQVYNFRDFKNESDFYTEGEFIEDLYIEFGDSFATRLDGEFAYVLYDRATGSIIFGGDLFLTKPIFFASDSESFAISSYDSSLRVMGYDRIARLLPNSYYVLRKNSKDILRSQLYNWDLTQNIDTYERWERAFDNSVRKRVSSCEYPIVIPLSSGLDSGLIACSLANNFSQIGVSKVIFLSYLHGEDRQVILDRHQVLTNQLQKESTTAGLPPIGKIEFDHEVAFLKAFCPDFKYGFSYEAPLGVDPSIGWWCPEGRRDPGAVALSKLLRVAKRNYSVRVMLSGQGGDEIMGLSPTYGFSGKTNPSEFPKDLERIFPYSNFYNGANYSYLMKEEYVSGAHGIETRYPFLDKEVVQAFLNLQPKLKNNCSKSPIAEYLTKNKFPFSSIKKGFNPILRS